MNSAEMAGWAAVVVSIVATFVVYGQLRNMAESLKLAAAANRTSNLMAVLALESSLAEARARLAWVIPGVVAVLNALVLIGMWGKSQPQTWAFYVLAGIDVVAAVIMLIFWLSVQSQISDVAIIAVPVIAVLLVKAVLTVQVARKLPPVPPAT
mgnify:CR=1 FL=1